MWGLHCFVMLFYMPEINIRSFNVCELEVEITPNPSHQDKFNPVYAVECKPSGPVPWNVSWYKLLVRHREWNTRKDVATLRDMENKGSFDRQVRWKEYTQILKYVIMATGVYASTSCDHDNESSEEEREKSSIAVISSVTVELVRGYFWLQHHDTRRRCEYHSLCDVGPPVLEAWQQILFFFSLDYLSSGVAQEWMVFLALNNDNDSLSALL